MDEQSLARYRDRYVNTERPRLKRFEGSLKALVDQILRVKHLRFLPLESRTKDPDSFVDKLRRKDYQHPFADMTDLVGVRIVTYTLQDVERVASIIERVFVVDPERSVRSRSDDPNVFGYESQHFIVSLTKERRALDEWSEFGSSVAEIQLRTVMQHAWAAMSHQLDYKSVIGVPSLLKRRLARLSALIELADEQFSELRVAREKLDQEYADQVKGGQLDIPLNADSLAAYYRTSGNVGRLAELAADEGWTVQDDETAEQRDQLLRILRAATLDTMWKLDDVLSIDESRLRWILRRVAEVIADSLGGRPPRDNITGITLMIVMVEKIGPIRQAEPEIEELLLGFQPVEDWMIVEPVIVELRSDR